MKTIYKYKLQLSGIQYIEMPVGAKILTVQLQNGERHLWAEVDNEAEIVQTPIYIVGTGERIPENTQYLCSVQEPPFMWQVYQKV